MTDNLSWIGSIDHRISAAVIFFVLFLLLNTAPRQSFFPLRVSLILLAMCAVSWILRTLSDVVFSSVYLQGLCYSAQIMLLHPVFLFGSYFCYSVPRNVGLYHSLLALTIYKAAWNAFKTGASLTQIFSFEAPYGRFSIAGSLVSYLVYFAVCLMLFLIYRKNVQDPPRHAPVSLMVQLTAIFVPLQMVLEYCGHVYTAEIGAQFLYYLCALLYTVLNFAALLMIASLDSFRHENRTMHDFISNKMRYYEMSHEGILSLQTKCHDLKHQIRAIRSEAGKAEFARYLNELEESINEYSTVIECGHPTVDIVLTEKNILCYSNQVKFSYMIDGSIFAFLSEREIYSLFGNAMDNALEAVMKVQDPALRMITLKGNLRGDLVVLQVENTYAGEMSLPEDALPRTTKTSSGHGFGLRSIRHIAEKYGGTMSLRSEAGIFKLSVFMKSPGRHT